MIGNFGKIKTVSMLVLVLGVVCLTDAFPEKQVDLLIVNGSLPVSANQTGNGNLSGDDGQLVGNDSDTKPESDDGIPDTFDFVLVILFVILLAGISIGTILYFRRRSIKNVEWEEEEEWTDEDYDDDEPIPEEGKVDSGNL